MEAYSVVAFNTATASLNKIHDDEVAASLGFRGGLVPGVDVYAYLCHPPAERWGLDWLRHGTMRARFHSPVYDGDTSHVSSPDGERLELHDDEGGLCAEGAASLGEPVAPPDVDDWPDVPQTISPPPAAPEVLVPGTAFGLEPHGFHADKHVEYLADVREELPLYREAGVAHPGWVLRDANYVLSANVRLGPWIHVESVGPALRPDRGRPGGRLPRRSSPRSGSTRATASSASTSSTPPTATRSQDRPHRHLPPARHLAAQDDGSSNSSNRSGGPPPSPSCSIAGMIRSAKYRSASSFDSQTSTLWIPRPTARRVHDQTLRRLVTHRLDDLHVRLEVHVELHHRRVRHVGHPL